MKRYVRLIFIPIIIWLFIFPAFVYILIVRKYHDSELARNGKEVMAIVTNISCFSLWKNIEYDFLVDERVERGKGTTNKGSCDIYKKGQKVSITYLPEDLTITNLSNSTGIQVFKDKPPYTAFSYRNIISFIVILGIYLVVPFVLLVFSIIIIANEEKII